MAKGRYSDAVLPRSHRSRDCHPFSRRPDWRPKLRGHLLSDQKSTNPPRTASGALRSLRSREHHLAPARHTSCPTLERAVATSEARTVSFRMID